MDIHTIDSFRRKTKSHVDRLQSTGRAEVLTLNGRPALVVQDAGAYELQMEKLEILDALAESAKQSQAGKTHDARKAIRSLIDGLNRQ